MIALPFELGKMDRPLASKISTNPCTTVKDIARVGAIFCKVGKEGVITLEDGKSFNNELDVSLRRSPRNFGCEQHSRYLENCCCDC
jgi:hypothetical protein